VCSSDLKANEVLNNKKTTFRGVFKFEMNGIQYTIERRGTKKKEKHVKVDVDFYTDTENLNGEERSDTNKSIRRYLGTYDDFILTAFSLQADNNNFIEKSQKERKDLLSQFLDITVFEQLYQLAADEIKETAGRLKDYKKTDFAELIIDADAIISKNQSTIQQLEQDEDVQQDLRNTLQEKIVSLIETKLPTTYDGPNIKILQRIEKDLESSIETLQQDIESAEQDIFNLKQNITDKKIQIKAINVTELQTNLQTLSTLESDIAELNRQWKLQHGVINAKQEKINHLSDHEYDPECKYCTSNVFVKNAIEAKNTIDRDKQVLADLAAQITDIDDACDALGIYRIQESNYSLLSSEKELHLKTESQERTVLSLFFEGLP
jgi:DNA repair exonuclease SbcCD ATPase subunit